MTESVIRSIPLDRLVPSPANVRKTPAGKAAFDELKASIAAHGLIENLVARSTEACRGRRRALSPSSPAPDASPQ